MNKKEFYQKLDNLESIISKLGNKIIKLENDLEKEKLSKNITNQKIAFVTNSGLEYYPTTGEQCKDTIYAYVDNVFKFNVGYIKALNFLTDFEPSCIKSVKLREEMLSKKIGDLKRCEIEDLAPEEKSIIGNSVYTTPEVWVSKVLNQPFKFDPTLVIRVAKYIQEVQDFDYKVSKYAEFKTGEEE